MGRFHIVVTDSPSIGSAALEIQNLAAYLEKNITLSTDDIKQTELLCVDKDGRRWAGPEPQEILGHGQQTKRITAPHNQTSRKIPEDSNNNNGNGEEPNNKRQPDQNRLTPEMQIHIARRA